MILGRSVLGLDIGSYSVKAVELTAGLQGVEFVRLVEARLPQGADGDRDQALELFLAEHELPREFVVCALASDRVTQRHLRFPFNSRRKIAQAIPFELSEDLAFPLEQAVITHDQVEALPGETDVLVILAQRPEIESYLGSLAALQLDPRVLEAEGTVVANLCRYLDSTQGGRLVLDIGHSKTDLCLLVAGKPILLRRIVIAGHHLTEALAKDLELGYEEAEQYKHEHGIFEDGRLEPTSPSAAKLLDRLIREAIRSIQSLADDPLHPLSPEAIVLVGGSARLPGLCAYIADQSHLPCSVLEVPGEKPECRALAEAGPAVFAQAAALALRGSTSARVTRMDLRQDEFAYTPDLSGLSSQLRLSLVAFAICLILWPLSLWSDLRAGRAQSQALHAQLQKLCTETFRMAKCSEKPFKVMEVEARNTRELADHLGVTGNGLSALEVLRELSARIDPKLEISLRELKVERRSLLARGHSRDLVSVDRMKEALSRFESFDDVRLTDVQANPRGGGKTFSLTIKFREGT